MMKNYARVSALILILLVLLCSCLTATTNETVYTEEEAQQAMHVVMDKTVKSANTRFFQKLATISFLPEAYRKIEEQKDYIPGMQNILDSWNKYLADFIAENRSEFEKQTVAYTESIVFENPMEMIKSSKTSGTEYLSKLAEAEFVSFLSDIVSNIDFSKLDAAVNQYNAWVSTENFMNKSNLKELEKTDASGELIDFIYKNYQKNLSLFEELYRTTPDPYTEEIIIKVFGIR